MSDPIARIRAELDRSLFVEAGAGAGKTHALVERLHALIASGVPVSAIVAITFTEKAAAELRARVRERLEDDVANGEATPAILAALGELDAAPISTIHAFASGLVRAFAAEAGVDPDFSVLDEIASERRFQQRWQDYLERLGAEPAGREAIGRALRLGLRVRDIDTLGRLIWQEPATARRLLDEDDPPVAVPVPDLGAFAGAFDDFHIDEKPVNDPLRVRLEPLLSFIARLREEGAVERETLLGQTQLASIKVGNRGSKKTWGDDAGQLRELAADLLGELVAWRDGLRQDALRAVARLLAVFAVEDRRQRCREGALTFDDLIQVTAELVMENPSLARRLRDRYHAFLIDEFQDTDPAQYHLAAAFGLDGPIEDRAGRLFLVGDPKQSIYRFRRADMAIYDRARRALAATAAPVLLDTSRRSVAGIFDWVNRVFAALFDPAWPSEVSPPYQPLGAHRTDSPAGPPVAVFGRRVADGSAADIRHAEVADIAAICQHAVASGWHVMDKATREERQVRYGDIAILMPTRSSLPALERALESGEIPFRVESGSLVFQTQELRDLINVLTAIDDPADAVAIVGALRSPAFACSDVDLVVHRKAGGSFNYLSPRPAEGPVADALARIRALHERRPLVSLARLVQDVLAETGYVASALLDRQERDSFRRARFLVDRARAFEADGPQSLRAFVDWLEERGVSPIVDHDGAMLDEDEDAVRVLTVHASKGLEFPVVIAAGFNANPQSIGGPIFTVDDATGRVAVAVGAQGDESRCTCGPADAVRDREKQHQEAELIRLLYVATTRARDHLVVSLHHVERSSASGAARLVGAGAGADVPLLDLEPASRTPGRGALDHMAVDPPAYADADALAAACESLRRDRSRLRATSATALVEGSRDDESEPWARGRGSTRVGRAVHAVIQSVPLDASPDVVAGFARAQAAAEGIPDAADRVHELAMAALSTGAAARARSAPRALREVPFAFARDGGTLVEGFIDLVIDTGRDLEIVDWKTDGISRGQIAGRLENYRLQAGLYAAGLEAATGRPISRVTYVFLAPGVEQDLGDPAPLVAEAMARLDAASGV